MALAFTSCGKDGKTGDLSSSENPSSDTALPSTTQTAGVDYNSLSKDVQNLGGQVHYADEQNGDVLLVWVNPKAECDRIELLRGSTKETLTVLSAFGKEGGIGCYIDKGEAGKGYYYAIRGIQDSGLTGVPNPFFITQSAPSDRGKWYQGSNGYARVDLPSLEGEQGAGIGQNFLLFNADGVCMKEHNNYNPTHLADKRKIYSETGGIEKDWEYELYNPQKDDWDTVVNVTDSAFEYGLFQYDAARANNQQYFTTDYTYSLY